MIQRLFGKINIYKDFLLSLLASVITTAVVQLIVNPVLARKYSSDEYGVILTLVGVANMLILAFGNSLNNTRLIVQADYDRDGLEGDFMPLCIALSFLAAAVLAAYMLCTGIADIRIIIPLSVFVLVGTIRNYGSVIYRVFINYVKNLWMCMAVAAGNAIGIVLVIWKCDSCIWTLVYLLGEILGIIFLYSSGVFQEKFSLTRRFRSTLGKEAILLGTTFSANLLVYLDRLLLYPLLGGTAVSTYTVASFFGKSLGIVMNPMAGVLLSYYAKKDYRMTRKRFTVTNILVLVCAAAFIGICAVFSKWITGIFYPTIIGDAEPILMLANIAAVISVAANMTTPAVMKFAPTYWQIIIQGGYLVVYLGLGVFAAGRYGLRGFAYAALAAAIFKFVILFVIGDISINNYEKHEKTLQ